MFVAKVTGDIHEQQEEENELPGKQWDSHSTNIILSGSIRQTTDQRVDTWILITSCAFRLRTALHDPELPQSRLRKATKPLRSFLRPWQIILRPLFLPYLSTPLSFDYCTQRFSCRLLDNSPHPMSYSSSNPLSGEAHTSEKWAFATSLTATGRKRHK